LDGASIVAQKNYWGQASGINPAELTLSNGASLDDNNHLTENPF
jgi:hypothetical protein